ncbi:MAG: hypothetical protein IJX27_00260 [Clostridia bacterium]|nr:hypothetical protein [Clostridia bacterium]
MSEAEKRRRFYYRQNRNKWLRIGALILAGATLITVIFAAIFFSMNKSTFIEYTEKGDVEYKVFLKDNGIFTEDSLGEDNMYVASLIDNVLMTFTYELQMEQEAKYSYSYSADALIVIKDKTTKKLIYKGKLSAEEAPLIDTDEITLEKPQQKLSIKQPLMVNYGKYNARAKDILEALSLKDVTCTLEVAMEISVRGSADGLEQDKENSYNFSLNMPLNADKVSLEVNSAIPTGANKLITTNESKARVVMLIITIILFLLTLLFAGVFVAFIFLTRNTDINYNIKVKRVVSSYKSYIQKIINPFDRTGYQLLVVDTFTELLEIRDTIQSPILMNENEDKTCTSFMIPTNTKLLYLFEIKVADYDEIYRKVEEGEETPITTDELPEIIVTDELPDITEDGEEKELVLLEEADEEELAKALAEPDLQLSEIDYDDEDDGVEAEDGVEVIGVVWPEQEKRSKIYSYDPNGEQVAGGDTVLVPSKDETTELDIIRKATVARGNHKVDPETVTHPLMKIIGVFKRKAEAALMPKEELLETEEEREDAVNAEVFDEAEAAEEIPEITAEKAEEEEAEEVAES